MTDADIQVILERAAEMNERQAVASGLCICEPVVIEEGEDECGKWWRCGGPIHSPDCLYTKARELRGKVLEKC